jgi:hypothetical protein
LTAASLHNAVGDEVVVLSLGHEAFQYDVWYDERDVSDRTVIYVSTDNNDSSRGSPEQFYQFDCCEPQPQLPILRRGVQINEARFWLCTGYEGSAGGD